MSSGGAQVQYLEELEVGRRGETRHTLTAAIVELREPFLVYSCVRVARARRKVGKVACS